MKYPFKIVVISIVLAILGIAVVPLLPVNLKPASKEQKLSVTYSLPNAAPAIVEGEATSILENVLSQIEGVNKIYSVSNYNHGAIELTFDKDTDLDFKRFEIAALIRQVYSKLPDRLSYPVINQGSRDAGNDPLIIYRLSAAIAGHQLKKFAKEHISNTLSYIEGVNQVKVRGAEDIQITIRFDYDQLSRHKLDLESIRQLINEQFQVYYLGLVTTKKNVNYSIRSGGDLISVKQLESLVIKNEGNPIRLKDIAEVYLEESDPAQYYRVNGLNSITISVFADENVNKIALADAIYKETERLQQLLPQGNELLKDFDDSDFLREELGKIYQRAGLSIFILTLFIFLMNRNWRYLVTLLSGVMINLAITSLMAYLLQIQIHLYTIAGITIAFGLIVDNAMVMVDHLHRKRNMRIFSALLGASLTTIVALMLVFFLPEEEKRNLMEFAQIIALSLFISLVVALFYTPSMMQLLGSSVKIKVVSIRKKRYSVKLSGMYFRGISFIAGYRRMFLTLVILGFGLPVFLLPASIEGQPFYNKTIGSDLYQEHIRPYTDQVLGGALRLFVRDVFEKSGYRTPEKTRLYVRASLPFGSTLDQVNDVMQKVEDYLKTVNGVSQFVTEIYSGRHGNVTIEFDETFEVSALPYQLKSRLIARSLDWGGVEWSIYGVGRGFSNSSSEGLPAFRVMLKGYNYNELANQAHEMAQKLLPHKRIQKVNTNERLSWSEKSTQEYSLHFKSRDMLVAHFDPGLIRHSIYPLSQHASPDLYVNYQENNMPVHFKEAGAQLFSKFDVMNKNINTHQGIFNLKPVSDLVIQKTANAIHKENRQYIRVLGFEYYGSFKFGDQYLDEVMDLHSQEMPLGYKVEKFTRSWSWDKQKRQYGLILILLVGIFFICSILFENLKQPVYIIACVPISFIGLFLIFSLFNFYFDQGGYAAFVLLGGLVVNAAIFVVNDLNNYHAGSYNKNVIKAILGKSQPILLTILSTCFGLIPFLVEGQNEVFWFSLAIGTIGGLIFSLLAVFVCLPVFLFKKG